MHIASSTPVFDGLNRPSFSTKDIQALRTLHPSDIAEVLESEGNGSLQIIEALLSVGNCKAVQAFGHLSIETQKECLETGYTRLMLKFIEGMSPDDRVDLLKSVDPEIFEAMMPLISKAERNEIRRLWDYSEGTAGSVMTSEYAFLPADIPVRTALERLRLQAPNKETIYYIYITDVSRKLIGIVSLRDLILSKPDRLVKHIMETRVISVPHEMPKEKVAALISKYDFLALPVVDNDKRLLGIITVDDVIDIMEAEDTEDFHRMSAVVPFEEEYFKRPLNRLFWNRFWWLAILLFTSLLSTTIMELNSAVLHQMMALSFFIPMVTGTCGNAGTQSATMVVRALALGEVRQKDFLRVFRRELLMGFALGAALGLMAYFRVFLQDHNMLLACIVGAALFGTLLTANLAGALMPIILKRIKLDPALTAGPFIATIIDAVGITLYFQIALVLLRTFN
ncbi:MAG: magnesium transporter [Desulfobacteraceae bacterium]|jgi:magnesium transporter